MKPTVYKDRKTEVVYIEDDIDIEYLSIEDVISYLQKLKQEADTLTIDKDLARTPYIDYEYCGYDGGYELVCKCKVYNETEEEWKARVKREKVELATWEAKEQREKEAIAAKTKKIAELEEEIKALKSGGL